MSTQMNIPSKIHVGLVNRKDTYTGKLGYVIYTDEKGVKRKEQSWEGWRNKNIPAEDYDNEPTSGFVLNRNGGGRCYSSWDSRSEFVRVYDPRGFEFEIKIWNLLFILQECTSTKGKGLEGEFVYAWSGKDLVLMPTECKEYKESMEYTSLKSLKVGKKDMIVGATYLRKDQGQVVYLGRHDVRYAKGYYISPDYSANLFVKKHVFFDLSGGIGEYDSVTNSHYIFSSGFAQLAKVLDTDCHPNYADMHQYLIESDICSECIGTTLIPLDNIKSAEYKRVVIKFEDKYFIHKVCDFGYGYLRKKYEYVPYVVTVDVEKDIKNIDANFIDEDRRYSDSVHNIKSEDIKTKYPGCEILTVKLKYASGKIGRSKENYA